MFFTERRVVDNRVFLLGLDELYRAAMKQHEREELLICARRVAGALHVKPANVPVEGYYAEEPQLTEYFRLVRALQGVEESHTSAVAALPEFQRLQAVTSASLYGHPQWVGKLLPVGHDALSQALLETQPQWTVTRLITAAYTAASEMDDISLVGLAALVKDPVILAAVRESVVLYAMIKPTAAYRRRRPKYAWKVDRVLAEQARRFIEAFNALFDEELPQPDPVHAEQYWYAYKRNEILGRCVRLGYDDTQLPVRYYHWAICRGPDEILTVQDFWHSEVWTTDRYRGALDGHGRCLDLGFSSF
jgi:hypothetical protein